MNIRVSSIVFALVLVIPAEAASVSLGQSRTAHAASCAPIPGHATHTAVIVNPSSTVTGTIDATGCDYGVYVSPGHSATVSGATIFGAGTANVAADGSVAVSGSHLYASPDGIDFGEFGPGPGGTATDNTIEYIDNGCGMMPWGGRETLIGNLITGPGQSPDPDGIDAFGGAMLTVIHNTIVNNNRAMLLYSIGPGSIVMLNTVQNNVTGIETQGTNTLVAGNTARMNTTGIDPDGKAEKVAGNTVCASTNATTIETADALSPPIVLANRTNC